MGVGTHDDLAGQREPLLHDHLVADARPALVEGPDVLLSDEASFMSGSMVPATTLYNVSIDMPLL